MDKTVFRLREHVFIAPDEGFDFEIRGDRASWTVGMFGLVTYAAVIPRGPLERFWNAVRRVGAWSWDGGSWHPELPVLDGEEWELEMQHGKRACKASGTNAWPRNYAELRAAVAEVLGAAALRRGFTSAPTASDGESRMSLATRDQAGSRV